MSIVRTYASSGNAQGPVARALDAADGVMDGKYYGKPIVEARYCLSKFNLVSRPCLILGSTLRNTPTFSICSHRPPHSRTSIAYYLLFYVFEFSFFAFHEPPKVGATMLCKNRLLWPFSFVLNVRRRSSQPIDERKKIFVGARIHFVK